MSAIPEDKQTYEVSIEAGSASGNSPPAAGDESPPRSSTRAMFEYLKTPRFYGVLLLGQILSLGITGTNTLSGLLAARGNSIPAFQTFFNYVLLNVVYTSITLYKYGVKGWCDAVYRRGWKYFIFAFLDVEGNYFAVLAYRYTTTISAQLINFWAIVVVVVISFLFLRVRYHWTQVLGILVCCGGMGVLLYSDSSTGASSVGGVSTELKGDLFMLLGATVYGVSNVAEEFLVSKQPLYEVVGQLGFWGMMINGVQAAIFDRQSFRSATWDGKVGGYLTGYTLVLFVFYTLAPLMFRLASAAFFNISLLTANFYGVAIGIRVFGYTLAKLYPVAFVMIILGLFVYFIFSGQRGEAEKPWLGENQEEGVAGVGTAKKSNTPRTPKTAVEQV